MALAAFVPSRGLAALRAELLRGLALRAGAATPTPASAAVAGKRLAAIAGVATCAAVLWWALAPSPAAAPGSAPSASVQPQEPTAITATHEAATPIAHCEATSHQCHAGVAPDGSFRFGPLAPGRYQLSNIGWMSPFAPRELAELEVRAGATTDAGTLRLPSPPVLELRVRRRGGGTVDVVYVELLGGDGQVAWTGTWSDERWTSDWPRLEGTFTLRVLPTRRILGKEVPCTLRPGARTVVELELEPAACCRLELHAPRPIGEREVSEGTLRHAGGEQPIRVFGRSRTLTGLQPGRYTVALRTNDGLRGTGEFEVRTPDDDLQVGIRLH